MLLSDLPTPQVLIDRPRALGNIDRAQQLASNAGVALRPHAKTHKSPVVAKWQIDRGAVGVCCAKVGEAEVFVDAGIANIRLPYPVSPSNAARILALLDRARFRSSSITWMSRAAGPRRWSAPDARSTC